MLFNDVRDRGCNSKYKPKSKPTVMGVYQVDRIVAKQIQGGKSEFFVQWKDHSSAENTWELIKHLPEELIAVFESRIVDPVRTDECKERLALLFEKGLKSPLACNETITMRHDVLRSIFPSLPSDLRDTPHLVSEEELLSAGFGHFHRRCLTVTGGGCLVDTPISLKLFLGKSPTFLDEQGRKAAPRSVEKVQFKFKKNYFMGDTQWD